MGRGSVCGSNYNGQDPGASSPPEFWMKSEKGSIVVFCFWNPVGGGSVDPWFSQVKGGSIWQEGSLGGGKTCVLLLKTHCWKVLLSVFRRLDRNVKNIRTMNKTIKGIKAV